MFFRTFDVSMKDQKEELDQDELYVHYEIVVDKGQDSMRIDKYLMGRLERTSRNRVQNAIKAGAIIVNDRSIKANYKIRPQDHIKVVLTKDPSNRGEVLPENIPIDVCYEDESIMVINKPSGLVVHPGIGNYTGTLVNALTYYFQNSALPVLKDNPLDRPGLVHRIDKDTSGLMVIAKTEYAMSHLAKQFFNHTVERRYHALVWGNFDENEGTIEGNLGRSARDRLQMMVYEDGSAGKPAITHYRVLRDYYYVSLVECQLETGRTHQIRAHMKYIKHPLFADARYGGDQIKKGTIYTKYKQFVQNCFTLCNRQCLHAKTLGFIHPVTEEYMRFDSEMPEDIQSVIDKWEGYYRTKYDQVSNKS